MVCREILQRGFDLLASPKQTGDHRLKAERPGMVCREILQRAKLGLMKQTGRSAFHNSRMILAANVSATALGHDDQPLALQMRQGGANRHPSDTVDAGKFVFVGKPGAGGKLAGFDVGTKITSHLLPQ